MTIIEVDGSNVVPLVVDSIQIYAGENSVANSSYKWSSPCLLRYPGQRYSFIVSIQDSSPCVMSLTHRLIYIAPRKPEDQQLLDARTSQCMSFADIS